MHVHIMPLFDNTLQMFDTVNYN